MLKDLKNLRNVKKSSQDGFTIIEVMIVLAIAALIILIVLLAVPALQRSSRNTTIKNDASTIAGAITTFQSNFNGTMPTSVTSSGEDLTLNDGTGTGSNTDATKVNGGTAVTDTTDAPADVTVPSTIVVHLGYRCDGQVNARAAAIQYAIETSGGVSATCIDS